MSAIVYKLFFRCLGKMLSRAKTDQGRFMDPLKRCDFLTGHSRPLFLYFCLFYLNLQLADKICQCWDLNCGSLVSKATALPTEPPPLHNLLRSLMTDKARVIGTGQHPNTRSFYNTHCIRSNWPSCIFSKHA